MPDKTPKPSKKEQKEQHRAPMYNAMDTILKERGEEVPSAAPEKPKKTLGQKIRNGVLTALGILVVVETAGTGAGIGLDPNIKDVKAAGGNAIGYEALRWPGAILERIKNGEKNIEQWPSGKYATDGPKLFENGYEYIPLSAGFKDGKPHKLNFKLTEWAGNLDGGITFSETVGPFHEGETYGSPYHGEIWFRKAHQSDLKYFYLDVWDSEGKVIETIPFQFSGLTRSIQYDASNEYLVDGEPMVRIQVAQNQELGKFSEGGEVSILGSKDNCPIAISPTPDGKAINID